MRLADFIRIFVTERVNANLAEHQACGPDEAEHP